MKNNKYAILMPLMLSIAVVIGILIGMNVSKRGYNSNFPAFKTMPGSNDKISRTMSLIKDMYVDSVNLDSIAESVIPEIMKKLDPHSVYIPYKDMGYANEALDGQFDGIGVVFNMMTDTILVLNVISGGPSEKAGIQNGDRIIKINDSIVAGKKIGQSDVVKKLRGPRGTTVDLGVQRAGIKELVKITVERGVIPIKSLDAAFIIAPKIGFIKLTAFSKNSHDEIISALSKLKQEGMTKLIFDLRGNSGGFLDQAILISNEFLGAEKMIVYTVDGKKRRAQEFSDGKGRYTDIEMAVLIDEGSASSSEILAGALQDNDRGTILGRRSFGKGLVQQQIPYGDGSALRLTIARYYTPTGRSIQKPYDHGNEEYSNDLLNRYNHSEFFSVDSIKFADSLKFTTPGGKVVYGGGGIMPDIFIPMDTTEVTRYFMQVSGRNILFRYTLEYTDKHRSELNKIKSVGELNAFFAADTKLLSDFVTYASRNGVVPNAVQIKASEKILVSWLKAYIGRNTPLEDVGFYSNIYPIDNVITRAIDELDK